MYVIVKEEREMIRVTTVEVHIQKEKSIIAMSPQQENLNNVIIFIF